MNLPSPPGYGPLAPLDTEKHCGLGVRRSWPHLARLNAVYLTGTEFFVACKEYPIVFSRDAEGGVVVPVALTGLESRNLYTDAEGRWDEGVYVPAYARQYPFCTLDVRRQEHGPVEQLICVDETALTEEAPALFDADGAPGEAWKAEEKFIRDFGTAREQTRRMMLAIEQAELLEPFAAQFLPSGAGAMRLDGMLRVDENRLNRLGAKALRGFMARGELSRIYAHLISLDNFRHLLDRFAGSPPSPPGDDAGAGPTRTIP